MVAQPEEEEAVYNIDGLNFHEPLSWRAGKPIAVADLFTRLQKLSNELRTLEQVEVKDIAKLAQDLVHPNLLGHKDKGIRAWTVTCVVDVLNICAPNAPYRPHQLKDIFTVIINTIIPALADPSNAYNVQHMYVLDQLVDAQSIVLITDIQDAESLINQLFSVCFDVVSGSGKNASAQELAQTVVFQITMLLNTVVDEANLPPDVIDIIISQFLRVDPRSSEQPTTSKKRKDEAKDKSQSTLLLKDYPPAYNLAKSVCTTCSEKMSAAISQYFSTIITSASADLADEDDGKGKVFKRALTPDSEDEKHDQESMNDLRKAHRLVRELWRACPDVLQNVLPQLELELSADTRSLRKLAVETLGDIMAGIGLAGLPDLSTLDAAVFPQPTIENADISSLSNNEVQRPAAPKPFIHVHANIFYSFMGRRIDKAAEVRIAWTKATSKILLTRAGGMGFQDEELSTLVSAQAKMLKDVDEHVRLAALQSLECFPYHAVIELLGSDNGLSDPASLLSTVADRMTDRKLHVREQAMTLLGTMWGIASRDLANGNERVRAVLGSAPSKIMSAMYTKEAHVTALVTRVLYERLLPLSYPPIKGKTTFSETQGDGDGSEASADPDSLRVKRLLTLVRDLDEKAKPVFFGLQKRRAELSKGMTTFLKACEEYNGGIVNDATDEKRLEDQLSRFIDALSRTMPEPSKASNDLWKFAKAHDRRSYQLIRFATGAEQDYRTLTKAIKELNKRLKEAGTAMSSALETLMPVIYQCALISYSRSHIPAIMEYARSSDTAFADAAKEVLRDISEKVPEVMKTHIEVLCKELETSAPTEESSEPNSAADALKACSAFARQFPDEIPSDRKFYTAMLDFVLYSHSPRASKHAASILLTASSRKEFHAKEILTKTIQRYNKGVKNQVAQLAAIAQVCLLAPSVAASQEKEVQALASSALEHKGKPAMTPGWDQSAWSNDVDDETAAKQFAMKIYVNQCRAIDHSKEAKENFDKLAKSAMEILMQHLGSDGELRPTEKTTSVQLNHLRLSAARYLLKLCRHKQRCEELLTPHMFHNMAWILVSPPYGVRGGLVAQLKKYLSQNQLNPRWLTLLFLLPFEPDNELRLSAMAWLKSRAAFYARQQKQARSTSNDKKPAQNVIELVFARLLSLLAHHPDFPIIGEEDYNGQMLDFAKYIVFYLQCAASEENLSLIFHVAQRVKQASDTISSSTEADDRLYILSDLSQATIRNYADQLQGSSKGTNLLQTWPGKAHLPNNLFRPINGHARAQEIAAKNYLPEEVALGLEALVRKTIRISKQGTSSKPKSSNADKKRKSSVSIDLEDDEADAVRKSAKKTKSSAKKATTSLPIRKTPNAKKRKSEQVVSVEQPSRKSARTSTATKKISYEESDEDEGDDAADEENVVKYHPAPVEKYKHKSNKEKQATPQIDEDVEEDQAYEEELVEEGMTSPTPHEKAADVDDEGDSENETVDVDMTNGHDQHENNNGVDENDAVGVDEEVAEVEDEEHLEQEAGTPSPPPKPKGRASRAKGTPKPAPASATKLKAAAKPTPPAKKAQTTIKGKVTAKSSKEKAPLREEPIESSPVAAEGTRRSSRRVKT